MMYCDVIFLISQKNMQDPNGYPVIQEEKKEVFADVRSVKRTEFFEALKAGISETIAFYIAACDYENQKIVEYEGIRYQVQRSYRTGMDWIELNCSEVKLA